MKFDQSLWRVQKKTKKAKIIELNVSRILWSSGKFLTTNVYEKETEKKWFRNKNRKWCFHSSFFLIFFLRQERRVTRLYEHIFHVSECIFFSFHLCVFYIYFSFRELKGECIKRKNGKRQIHSHNKTYNIKIKLNGILSKAMQHGKVRFRRINEKKYFRLHAYVSMCRSLSWHFGYLFTK